MRINPAALRALRERSGWAPTKFALEAGITPGFLSNIEAGRRQASPEVIVRMARVLDVPLMALISEYAPERVA